MKSSTLILAIGLLVAFSIGRASSDEAADATLNELREQVNRLQQQVAFLMVDHRVDQEDIKALSQRVSAAELLYKRTEALYESGGQHGSADQLHQSIAAFRLAQARLEFAKRGYETSMDHFDAALAASNQARLVLEAKLDAGTGTLSELIHVQQFVADIALERNQLRRRLEFLAANQ